MGIRLNSPAEKTGGRAEKRRKLAKPTSSSAISRFKLADAVRKAEPPASPIAKTEKESKDS